MGFAAGVMIAASFWSLLAPSIEYAQSSYGELSWLPAAIGFLVGGFFLRLIDAVVPHLHLSKDISEAESVPEHSRKKLSKTALLFLAITIHNFPEGLAVGVAFGALAANPSPCRRDWPSFGNWPAKRPRRSGSVHSNSDGRQVSP